MLRKTAEREGGIISACVLGLEIPPGNSWPRNPGMGIDFSPKKISAEGGREWISACVLGLEIPTGNPGMGIYFFPKKMSTEGGGRTWACVTGLEIAPGNPGMGIDFFPKKKNVRRRRRRKNLSLCHWIRHCFREFSSGNPAMGMDFFPKNFPRTFFLNGWKTRFPGMRFFSISRIPHSRDR